jgi:hypothetical protein
MSYVRSTADDDYHGWSADYLICGRCCHPPSLTLDPTRQAFSSLQQKPPTPYYATFEFTQLLAIVLQPEITFCLYSDVLLANSSRGKLVCGPALQFVVFTLDSLRFNSPHGLISKSLHSLCLTDKTAASLVGPLLFPISLSFNTNTLEVREQQMKLWLYLLLHALSWTCVKLLSASWFQQLPGRPDAATTSC